MYHATLGRPSTPGVTHGGYRTVSFDGCKTLKVPDTPGLGITLNDDVMKQHLAEPGYFEPTPQWDKETTRVNDRLFS